MARTLTRAVTIVLQAAPTEFDILPVTLKETAPSYGHGSGKQYDTCGSSSSPSIPTSRPPCSPISWYINHSFPLNTPIFLSHPQHQLFYPIHSSIHPSSIHTPLIRAARQQCSLYSSNQFIMRFGVSILAGFITLGIATPGLPLYKSVPTKSSRHTQATEPVPIDGDWSIGCDEDNYCSYYHVSAAATDIAALKSRGESTADDGLAPPGQNVSVSTDSHSLFGRHAAFTGDQCQSCDNSNCPVSHDAQYTAVAIMY